MASCLHPTAPPTGCLPRRCKPAELQACRPACRPFTCAEPQPSACSTSSWQGCTRQQASRPSLRAYSSSATPSQQSVDRKAGRAVYRPQSFAEIVDDAVTCVLDGIKDGLTRMEVEFPPVPTKLDGYKGASDVFIDSNVQLALAGARKLAEAGRKVHVLMPDQGEYDRAYKLFKGSLDVLGSSASLGHLKEGKNSFSLDSLFAPFEKAPDSVAAGQAADTYIMINATCVELYNVRDYIQRMAPEGSGKVVVLWNLELDSLRGDMGLPAFPPKDMHYEFLSYFRPVFYLRTRDYSKSVTVAPFLVNYSGALFREYPGPWQVMLKQDNGQYACIAEDVTRYNLGELKEELQAAMGLATEEEGSTMQVLRRGLKNSTWWEDDYDQEKSHEWRL